jgi:hypothetical protein
MQKFYANPSTEFVHPNGAIAYGPGGPFDVLGRYSKIKNCPVAGTGLRLTAYARNYADTHFSIPACARYKGKYIGGYFTNTEQGVEFRPMEKYLERF